MSEKLSENYGIRIILYSFIHVFITLKRKLQNSIFRNLIFYIIFFVRLLMYENI